MTGAAPETMERLSADDARILRLESDAIAGHTLKLAIVDRARDGQPLTVERVAAGSRRDWGDYHAPGNAWLRRHSGCRAGLGGRPRTSTSAITCAPLRGR